jgi:hypothetical protein
MWLNIIILSVWWQDKWKTPTHNLSPITQSHNYKPANTQPFSTTQSHNYKPANTQPFSTT